MVPTPTPETPEKISTFSRVLAWIFLVCFLLAAGAGVVAFFKSGRMGLGQEAILGLLSAVLITPLFAYAAITGRSPRWMRSMETMYDREAERRGIPPTSSGGWVTVAVAAIVFGTMLVAFGRSIGVFEGETGWFAAAIFFAAWVIVVVMLWRNIRKPPR